MADSNTKKQISDDIRGEIHKTFGSVDGHFAMNPEEEEHAKRLLEKARVFGLTDEEFAELARDGVSVDHPQPDQVHGQIDRFIGQQGKV